MADPQKIEEAEIVTPSAPAQPPAFDAQAYNATREIVQRRLSILDKAKDELKKLKEMFNDMFVNDSLYVEKDKLVKEAMKKRQDEKARISKQPAAADLAGKIKELKEEIKENEDTLTDELMAYYRTAGVTEIEDADGNVQEFAIVIKLKPKRSAK